MTGVHTASLKTFLLSAPSEQGDANARTADGTGTERSESGLNSGMAFPEKNFNVRLDKCRRSVYLVANLQQNEQNEPQEMLILLLKY